MSTTTDSLTVVRAHFDEVLADHIRKIVDLDTFPTGVLLNIATIASLVLLAEREEERTEFADFPPARYTRDSFMMDIREIGLGSDVGMVAGLDPLLTSSLVTESQEGELKPEAAAQRMLQVVNTLFPGMQGMNLVAYMVQTIDEVASGRKEIHDAKRFFLQTLNMHSLAGQIAELAKDREDSSKKGTFLTKPKKIASPGWNKNVLQKLNQMRNKRGNVFRSEEMQVREIFTGGPVEKVVPPAPPEPMPVQEVVPPAPPEPMPVQEVIAPAPQEPMPVQEVIAPAPQEPMPVQEVVPPAPPEPMPVQVEEEDTAAGDADIAARIAAFENALAMTCPLCKTGKLKVNQTEKGKEFYDCSQSSCHFISWSQPFKYTCPTCENPFLVAFIDKEGMEGLKCPRATCDYSQDARINPEEYQRKKKKKRKIVRRVKRKA